MIELPMFPLGSVLVPRQVLALHVFESRYRRLVGDCLEQDRPFGVVLIERGSEVGGGETRSDIGTEATLTDAHPTPDGRWAVIAVGVRRIRVVQWLDDAPYPLARVEPWPDLPPGPQLAAGVGEARKRFEDLVGLLVSRGLADDPGDITFDDDPVAAAEQLVAVSPLGQWDRQQLLACVGPDERMARLADMLDEQHELLAARFPPPE
jgi:Lon protease-like protein